MAAKSWKEAWAGDLAADLQSTVAAYASKGATQGSDQIGSRFLNETILKKMQDISECRNVTCCIGWTSPVKMSPLNEDLSFAMVAKFVDPNWKSNGAWAIPTICPRNWAIPIACFSLVELPPRGDYPRVEADLAAVAVWKVLADLRKERSTAKPGAEKEAAEKNITSVEKLMVNWPFDFIYFKDPSLVVARAVQYRDENETAREYFGLDGPSLLACVSKVEELLKASGKAGPTGK